MAQRELYLYDEIGCWGCTAEDFRQQLQALALTPADELVVCMSTPGGEIWQGLGMYASIRNANCAKRTVRVDGMAASMGSVIAMAGDEIVMGDGSLMMIHDPSWVAIGTSDEMRATADALDKQRDALVGIYARKSGKDVEAIKALMSAETWMTGPEAVAAGFATRVGAAMPQPTARFDGTHARYRHRPAAAAKYFTATASTAAPPPKEHKRMDKTQVRRRALMVALLCDVVALGAQEPDAKDLQVDGLQPRLLALKATPELVDQGSPLALLDCAGQLTQQELPSFCGAQAHLLVLSATAGRTEQTEAMVKGELIEAAILAGKPVAPAHKAAWQALPLASLKDTLARLPITNLLTTVAKKPSANPNAQDQADAEGAKAGDESYKGMHAGLGLKTPPKAQGGGAS